MRFILFVNLTKSCKWIIERAHGWARPRCTGECENELIIPSRGPLSGVRVRAERLYHQLDSLQPVRLQARHELLREWHKDTAVTLPVPDSFHRSDSSCAAGALLQTPHRFLPSASSGPTVVSRSRLTIGASTRRKRPTSGFPVQRCARILSVRIRFPWEPTCSCAEIKRSCGQSRRRFWLGGMTGPDTANVGGHIANVLTGCQA